jgi:hypothetical protein
MSHREEPEFYAWVDEPNASEAYLSTLATAHDPAVLRNWTLSGIELDYEASMGASALARSFEESLPVIREALHCGHRVAAGLPVILSWRKLLPGMLCNFPSDRGGGHGCVITVNPNGFDDITPNAIESTPSRVDLSVPLSAAILGLQAQELMETVLLTLCAPDAHSRVTTGAYHMFDKFAEMRYQNNDGWRAPLEMAGTYHGDHLVARDVAISWLYLHDGAPIDSVAGLSLDAFMARVEAAPAGSSVGISSQTEHVVKHGHDEWRGMELPLGIRSPVNSYRAPRPRFPEDHDLTREQVLGTLQTPNKTLLEALEAAATTDNEWIEAEKLALDWLAVKIEGEPTRYLYLDKIDQRNFLEAHAPYHVRRLQNGGVMLATHPYRYLWPLWAKALDLLGIRPLNA